MIERVGLIGAVEAAHNTGRWNHAWELACLLSSFFELNSQWEDWELTHRLALDAALASNNPYAEACVRRTSVSCMCTGASGPQQKRTSTAA